MNGSEAEKLVVADLPVRRSGSEGGKELGMADSLPSGTTLPRGVPISDSIRWPLVPARQLFELKYGKALVAADRRPGTVPVYGTNGRCGSHDKALFTGPGVILGRKGQGPLGVEWCDDDYWVIDTAYSLAPLRSDVDLKYAYFLIKFIGLNHLKDGTSNPTLSRDTFGAQAFPLPPLAVQRAIAHILGTLDDKIELNKQMNETLEAMARALFKSWFIDFSPVRRNADRVRNQPSPRPTSHPSPIGRGDGDEGVVAGKAYDHLFPDSFEDSELGEIPKGWEVKAIEAIAKRVGMGPFGSSIKVETFVPEGVPVISGQHLHGFMVEDNTFNFISHEHAERLRAANVQRGDLVFTHAGNIGQVAYIPENSRYDRYIISQRQFFMRCDLAQVTPSFLAFYFRSLEGQHRLLANASSSGVPSIARPVTYLRSIQLTIPPKPVMDAFEKSVQPLLTQFRRNLNEVNTLATLRDTLLPRLLSGEIRLKDVQAVTKEVL